MIFSNQNPKSPKKFEVLIGLLVFLLTGLFSFFGLFEGLENKVLDGRFQFRGPLKKGKIEGIALIGINQEDFSKVGPFPWNRAVYGQIIEKIKKGGARSLALDILFSELGQDLKGDEAFKKAMEGFLTILPSVIVPVQVFNQETYQLEPQFKVEKPHPFFEEAATALGFIDVVEHHSTFDGVVRSFALTQELSPGVLVKSLDLALYQETLKLDPPKISPRYEVEFFNYDPWGKFDFFSFRKSQKMLLNFPGPLENILFDVIPVHQVLHQSEEKDRQIFQNKMVYLGAFESRGVRDIKVTPFGKMPGVMLHAICMENLIHQTFLTQPSQMQWLFFLFILALFLTFFLRRFPNWGGNLLFLTAPLFFMILSQILFSRFLMVLPVVSTLFLMGVQWITTRALQSYTVLKENQLTIESKYRELSVIHEISKAINFMGNLDQTLESILDRAIKILKAERGSLMLYEQEVNRLLVKIKRGKFKFENSGEGLKPGEGVAGEVFNRMEPALLPNVHTMEQFVIKEELDKDIESLICIPLIVEKKSIGVLNLVNKNNGKSFTPDDLHLAVTLANQASILIQNARLYNLATVDGLTGLYVRRHFQFKLTEELSRCRRYEKPMAILLTDIDHFKKFNDTYGHQTGDLVLREVARLLKESTRTLDTAARYGGEEFTVILPETDVEGALILAERYRQKVDQFEFLDGDKKLHVTVSIGVATLEGADPENEKDFVQKADIALYHCKASGRNCVTHYTDALKSEEILKSS